MKVIESYFDSASLPKFVILFWFGKHVLWFHVIICDTTQLVTWRSRKKERLQRKAGIGYTISRWWDSVLHGDMQVHIYREISTTQEKRAFPTNRAIKGQFVSIRFEFNYHNYICSITGLRVKSPNRIRDLQMWLPPRRFTTSTRRNGCPGSILFLAASD